MKLSAFMKILDDICSTMDGDASVVLNQSMMSGFCLCINGKKNGICTTVNLKPGETSCQKTIISVEEFKEDLR